jgi:radical SAM protein with 4Fe4S-binding SPASM domain
LSTNGTLLNSRKVSELVAGGVQHFDIGFTDPSIETRLALTAAAKAGCSVTACICLHRSNHTRIGVLSSLAAALGADSIAINRFVPTGRGKQNREHLVPDTMNLLSALAMANETAIASGIHIYTGIPIEPCIASNAEFPGISFSTCQCGETKWAIDPRGNLRTCEQNKNTLGNLLETPFEDILNRNTAEMQKFRQWRPSTVCKSCDRSNGCIGGCRFQIF